MWKTVLYFILRHFVVICCCITKLSFKHIVSHIVPDGQESMNILAGWPWLQSSEDLTIARGAALKKVHPQDWTPPFLFGCWQKASVPQLHRLLPRAAYMSSWHGNWLPPEQVIKEIAQLRQKLRCLYHLISEVASLCHCHIVLVTQTKPAILKEEGTAEAVSPRKGESLGLYWELATVVSPLAPSHSHFSPCRIYPFPPKATYKVSSYYNSSSKTSISLSKSSQDMDAAASIQLLENSSLNLNTYKVKR